MKMTIMYFILIANSLLANGLDEFMSPGSNIKSPLSSSDFNRLAAEYQTSINAINNNSAVGNDIISIFSKAFEESYWCYPPYYGCFEIGGPFISSNRPISLPPYPPQLFFAQMQLYTRKNPKFPFIFFDPTNVDQIDQSNFNKSAPTIFLIGAFLVGDGTYIVAPFLPRLLANSDCNVINVFWSFASITTYNLATANTRMLGRIVGYFIEILHNKTGIPYSQVHLIGHSLGAQTAGYAGQYLRGQLGRISGLEPSGPNFNGTDPIVRLDPTDAQFVDNIHTNRGSLLSPFLFLGIDEPCGHVDFWPNGGKYQPDCTQILTFDVGIILQVLFPFKDICNHIRAVYYYAESIPVPNNTTGCKFLAEPCSSYSAYKCNQCPIDNNALEMGFNSDKYTEGKTKPYPVAPQGYYLETNGYSPYCKTNTVFNSC